MVPMGWSMPFFSSLIFTGTRVGGQRERETQSFESGVSYFPRDYPSTSAYRVYIEARAAEEKARWERKPPAKRVNFDKLGTRSPWTPDWEVVLGLEDDAKTPESSEFVTTQREVMVDKTRISSWLLRGPEMMTILSNASDMFNPAAGLWSDINKLRVKRGQDPLDASIKAEMLWKSALVEVKLVMCGRGAPDHMAHIYSVDDNEARKWRKMLQRKKNSGDALSDDDPDETEVCRCFHHSYTFLVVTLINSYPRSVRRKSP
jgi:ribonuclease P/MRP protein subunit POP1